MTKLKILAQRFVEWWNSGWSPKLILGSVIPLTFGIYWTTLLFTPTIPLNPQAVLEQPSFPSQMTPPPSTPEPTPIPTPEPPPTYTNILLLGYGGKGHAGGSLSDAILVLHLDPPKKKMAIITIPRDLWYENAQGGGKINRIHATGGGEAAKEAVEQIIHMKIHYFVSVDFSGFTKAIDTLGSITVAVPHTFDDYFYPVKGLENEPCGKTPEEITQLSSTLSGFELEKQFPCRYEHLHFEAGPQEMNGATALKFVRSRHSAQHGGDFARSQRQKAIVVGVIRKLVSLEAAKKVPEFFKRFSSAVKTDMTVKEVQTVVSTIPVVEPMNFTHVGLSTQNVLEAKSQGGYALVPKTGMSWDHVASFIKSNL